MAEECLICKNPLEYLEQEVLMVCALCGKKVKSRTRCIRGHFVCDECHIAGLDQIFGICLQEKSKDPVAILEKMMAVESCHMHGPEHHVMVGAALLTAYKHAGGSLDLDTALLEMYQRGKEVPGGACGFWGACGAGISTGMFVSIATKATPLGEEVWGLANQMTGRALQSIGEHGGPRCCKRDSYLAVLEAVSFTKKHFGICMETGPVFCSRSEQNAQCRKEQCPFYIH